MHPRIQILIICAICILTIVSYGTYRCHHKEFRDPLTNSMLNPSQRSNFFDGWGILHFAFYFGLAFAYSEYWAFIFILGVLWEITESLMKDHPFYLSKCDAANVLNTDGSSAWWYGRWQDLVMNGAGVLLGYLCAKPLRMTK
jgi:hypothetical protein